MKQIKLFQYSTRLNTLQVCDTFLQAVIHLNYNVHASEHLE